MARRIALSVVVVVLAGGAWFSHASRAPTAVATSCTGFEADARTLFERGGAVALNGTFAAGDHVHLTIDLNDVGYAWELKGVMAKEPDLKGSGHGGTTHTVVTTTRPTTATPPSITGSTGSASGYSRMDMDIVVTATGDGGITIRKTGLLSWFVSPRVLGANCTNPARPAI
jgi:hypothetical protein